MKGGGYGQPQIPLAPNDESDEMSKEGWAPHVGMTL